MPQRLPRALCVLALAIAAATALRPVAGQAATLTVACSAVGIEQRLCREGAAAWARESGHEVTLVQAPVGSSDRLGLYQQWLAARSAEVDVYQIDVIWPGLLAPHLIDLAPHVSADERAAHLPAILAANTVGGALKALPWYADVGLLFYRRDLLERYGRAVPRTWGELAETAAHVVAQERAAGRRDLHGFVFQGRAYEGLTCNALEWIASHGGGRILAADGSPALNTPGAVRALRTAAGWVGTIAPRGVLAYGEEEARGVFQAGRAVFMRNWPYAWALAQGANSPVRGKVGVAPLPAGDEGAGLGAASAGTLGGWGLAVSRYSRHPQLAVSLVRHLASPAEQKRRAIAGAYQPTLTALYEDPQVLAAQPFFRELPRILRGAVARPAALAGARYNRISATFWEAVHSVLSGRADAATALRQAERRLARLTRRLRR